VIYSAYAIYVKSNTFTFPQTGFLFRISYHEWYIDKLYHKLIIKPVVILSDAIYWFDSKVIDGFVNLLPRLGLMAAKIAAWTDRYIIDGLLHLFAFTVQAIGNFARRFQGGKIQYYLFSMLVVILALFILKILI